MIALRMTAPTHIVSIEQPTSTHHLSTTMAAAAVLIIHSFHSYLYAIRSTISRDAVLLDTVAIFVLF